MQNQTFNKELGARLRALRTFQNKSREKLAEEAGISVQFLAEIEYGRKSMTTNVLRRICEALHTSADYLLFARTESTPYDSILSMLSTLSKEQVVFAEELLRTLILAIQTKG